MTSGTNRTEYKRHLADDLEREVTAFLKLSCVGLYIGVYKNGTSIA
ncbi:hypothetical protein [Bacteroides cellulosilyticus]